MMGGRSFVPHIAPPTIPQLARTRQSRYAKG